MYYTPSIDEFHENMFYETLTDNGWEKTKFKIIPKFDIFKTRIKILDDTDLVELGFRYDGDSVNGTSFVKEFQSMNDVDYAELLLVYRSDQPFVSVRTSNGFVLFSDLNIKNKYELEWLLTRYGLV